MHLFDYLYIKVRLRAIQIYKEFIYKNRRLKIKDEFERSLSTNGISPKTDSILRKPKIIVSLTSFPPRYKTIVPCLQSLLMQSFKPDRIIVWLYEKDFPVTKEMESLIQYGIEFISVKEDLQPHKKYFYAMQEFPEDIIITVDDDVIYPQNMIQNLIQTHQRYPECVAANRVNQIIKKHDGSLFSYNLWIHNYTGSTKPRNDIMATGVGGVLYPPDCLDKRCFDIESIKKYCLGADDIWLKTMELLHGTKVVWAKNKCPLPYIIQESQDVALGKANVEESKNDNYIQTMKNLFKDELM